MRKRFLVLIAVVFAFILCGCNENKPELSVKFSRPPYDDFSYVLGVVRYDFEIEYREEADMGLVYMDTFSKGVKTTDKVHITGVAGFPKTKDGFTMQMSFCISDSKSSAFKVNTETGERTETKLDSGHYYRMTANSTFDKTANGCAPRIIPYEKFDLHWSYQSKVFDEFDCSREYIPIFYIKVTDHGHMRFGQPLKNGVIEVDPDYDYLILYLKTKSKAKDGEKLR